MLPARQGGGANGGELGLLAQAGKERIAVQRRERAAVALDGLAH